MQSTGHSAEKLTARQQIPLCKVPAPGSGKSDVSSVGDPDGDRRPRPIGPSLTLERAIASATILLLGLHMTLGFGITPGYLVAILLAPVWVSSLRWFWGARVLFWVAGAALLSGMVLSRIAGSDHVISESAYTANVGLFFGLFSGIGVVLWARSLMPPSVLGVLIGLSMGVTALTSPGTLGSVDPLKFGWTTASVVIVVSAFNQQGKLGRQLIGVLLGVSLCAISDLRSFFGVCLVSAVLLAWQMRPAVVSRRVSWLITTITFAGVAVGMYVASTALLVDGYLGAAAQARSVIQIQSAGSLILGGRPELAATGALITFHPMGFGIGVVPNELDMLTAKVGMARINYDPNNGYVERYMFGAKFELHSTAGDMWAYYGLAGAALALFIALLAIRSMAILLSARMASGIVLIAGWWTLWNLAFSPLLTSVPALILTMGLVLLPRSQRASGKVPILTSTRPARTPTCQDVVRPAVVSDLLA